MFGLFDSSCGVFTPAPAVTDADGFKRVGKGPTPQSSADAQAVGARPTNRYDVLCEASSDDSDDHDSETGDSLNEDLCDALYSLNFQVNELEDFVKGVRREAFVLSEATTECDDRANSGAEEEDLLESAAEEDTTSRNCLS